MQNLHGITNTDKRKRVILARHCQNQNEGMSEYLSKIVFPDECIFRLNRSVNTQNARIWSTNAQLKDDKHFHKERASWCDVEFQNKRLLAQTSSKIKM